MRSFLFFILMSCGFQLSAQTVFMEIYKDSFDISKETTISIKSDFIPDSINIEVFSRFLEVQTKSSSQTTSITNGKTTVKNEAIYFVFAKDSGTFSIESPKLYKDGLSYQAEDHQIVVTGNLSTAELEQRNHDAFVKKLSKPENTQRITFIEGVGFLEKYQNKKWKLVRELTEKELKLLDKKF